jgi:hypothetical protein
MMEKKITQQLDLGVLDARTWSIVIRCHCLYVYLLFPTCSTPWDAHRPEV